VTMILNNFTVNDKMLISMVIPMLFMAFGAVVMFSHPKIGSYIIYISCFMSIIIIILILLTC
jgi:hypothetical protein